MKILQNLRRIERKKRTFKKLKKIFKEPHSGQLSSVLTLKEKDNKDEPDEWVRITDNQEIQQLIRTRNEQHFNQASKTPIGDPRTMQMFKWDSDSDVCTKILQGKRLENLPKRLNPTIAQTMFEQFEVAAPKMEADISYEEFKETFSNWREMTTTSPSGRHLGHYCSLFTPDGTIDEDAIGEQIMLIHYQITMCAVATGTPLEWWKTCVPCHIKKDPGSPKLHRFRIIHIYKADMNLVQKLLWSRKLI